MDKITITTNQKPEGKIYYQVSPKAEITEGKMIVTKQNSSAQDKTVSAAHEMGKLLLANAKQGNIYKVADLLKQGAPFTSDWLGMTALHFAAANNHQTICELFIRAGASKDARTKVERTPLHLAVYYGHEDIVRLLLEAKCDVNAKDMLHMTALHWAIEKGHLSIARLLLKYGADVKCKSKFEKTPICIAIENGFLELLGELNDAKEQQEEEEKKCLDIVLSNESETQNSVRTIKVSPTENDATEYTISSIHTDDPNSNEFVISPVKSENIQNNSDTNYIETIPQSELSDLSDADTDNDDAMKLLQSHGISLLPQENTSTSFISSALNSGRNLVLSEAGKLVLNETKLRQSPILKEIKQPILLNQTLIKKDEINKAIPGTSKSFIQEVKIGPNKKYKVFSVKSCKKLLETDKNYEENINEGKVQNVITFPTTQPIREITEAIMNSSEIKLPIKRPIIEEHQNSTISKRLMTEEEFTKNKKIKILNTDNCYSIINKISGKTTSDNVVSSQIVINNDESNLNTSTCNKGVFIISPRQNTNDPNNEQQNIDNDYLIEECRDTTPSPVSSINSTKNLNISKTTYKIQNRKYSNNKQVTNNPICISTLPIKEEPSEEIDIKEFFMEFKKLKKEVIELRKICNDLRVKVSELETHCLINDLVC